MANLTPNNIHRDMRICMRVCGCANIDDSEMKKDSVMGIRIVMIILPICKISCG
jgi:hypothetical protein